MRCLVLGSAGQVGAALFDYLNRNGLEAVPFDIARSPKEDLRRSGDALEAAIADADFVFFLAFDVGGSAYLAKFQDTFDFIDNNVRIMANTFACLARHRKAFIFSSSQMSNMIFSNYGLLKAIGERYTAVLHGLTVKFWNVYGYESDPQKTHVVTDFIAMAARDRHIRMRTTGEEQRQFLYSEDCAQALLRLAQRYSEIPRDRELHITSFAWVTIRGLAHVVAELFPGTQVTADSSRDTVQLGQSNEPDPFILTYWQPETPLSAGVEQVARKMGCR